MTELLPVIDTERLRLRALETTDADDMAPGPPLSGGLLSQEWVTFRCQP